VILAALPDVHLGDLQQGARALLRSGVLTARDGQDLARVRRFHPQLDAAFSALCGYRVVLRGQGARLVRVRDQLDPTAVLRSSSGRPFDRDRLALLFLALSELDRFPHQVALSELASALRRASLDLGEGRFDPDQHSNRRAFCDVLDNLQGLGVLSLCDGGTESWAQDPDQGEALFDVDHDAASLLFRPRLVLERLASVQDFLVRDPAGRDPAGRDPAGRDTAGGRDPRRQSLRQRVARALVEAPVVLFDDLDADAAQYLTLEWRGLAEDVERLLGCRVERRKEGVALVDTAPGGLGERFPQGGSATHVALLLAERIARQAAASTTAGAPTPASRSEQLRAELDLALDLPGPPPSQVDEPPGPFLTTTWLLQVAAQLCQDYGAALKADHRADASVLLEDGLDLLQRFDLVRCVPGGVVATPALARYRRPELMVPAGAQVALFTPAVEDPA